MTERLELLQHYRNGYDAVLAALSRVDLDALPTPGEWTPRQIVHHLLDSELARAVRLRRLLTEEEPHIEGYDQDAWANVYPDRAIEPTLAAYKALMDANIALLEELTEEDWARRANHSEGMLTLIEHGAAHGHEHAEQIERCVR